MPEDAALSQVPPLLDEETTFFCRSNNNRYVSKTKDPCPDLFSIERTDWENNVKHKDNGGEKSSAEKNKTKNS